MTVSHFNVCYTLNAFLSKEVNNMSGKSCSTLLLAIVTKQSMKTKSFNVNNQTKTERLNTNNQKCKKKQV